MRRAVSSTLSSEVKYYCDNTATADVTSALEVLDIYCSAAASETVFQIRDSATESDIPTRTGAASSSPTQSSDGGNDAGDGGDGSGDDDAGTGGDSDGSRDGNDDADDDDSGDDGGDNQTAIIAGSVVGGVVVIALVAAGIFFYRRQQRKKNGQQLDANENSNTGPPELSGQSKGPEELSGYGKDVSPHISPIPPAYVGSSELHGGASTPPVSELPPQQAPPRELAANPYGQQQPHQQAVSPMGSEGNQRSPFGGSPQPGHAYPSVSSATPHNGQGLGWQSGPVESYELDSNMERRQG